MNSDGGVVGETRQELDVSRCPRARLAAVHVQDAESLTVPEPEWDGDQRAIALADNHVAPGRNERVGERVPHDHRLISGDSHSGDALADLERLDLVEELRVEVR